MPVSFADLSKGRLLLDLGADWNEHEHRQFGIPFYDKATRHELFAEGLEVTTRLLDSDTPVTYMGKHYSLNDAILLRRPKRPGGLPPIICRRCRQRAPGVCG